MTVVNFENAYSDHNFDGSHRRLSRKSDNATAVRYLHMGGDVTLQGAIDELSAGGTVYILPGYTESTAVQIVPVDNLAVICPSRDAVITDTNGALSTGMFATYTGTTGIDNVTLDGVHFISTGVAGTTRILYADYTPTNWRIEHCVFEDCYYGFQGSGRGGHMSNGFLDSVIRECRFYNCKIGIGTQAFNRTLIDHCYLNGEGTGEWGVNIIGCRDVIVRDTHVHNVKYDAFSIQSWSNLFGIIELRSCHAYDNNRYGFVVRGNTYAINASILLTGCRARRNSRHGFYFYGGGGVDARAICTNCRAIDNSYGTANGYSGFYLAGTCDRVELIGCRAYKESYAQQKYGFEIVAGATKCEVRGGVWSPNQTAAFLDNGTGTVIDARSD